MNGQVSPHRGLCGGGGGRELRRQASAKVRTFIDLLAERLRADKALS
jgi:hypothetical protein